MKTFIAEEGKVFKNGEEVLGNIIYVPDDFDESNLTQIDKPIEETLGDETREYHELDAYIMNNDSDDCVIENNIGDVL